MPSLHGFSTCWGNRQSFWAFSEECYNDWMGSCHQERETNNCSEKLGSSNGYYGYQPVRAQEETTSMEVESISDTQSNDRLRKRPSTEDFSDGAKRSRISDTASVNDSDRDMEDLEALIWHTHGCELYNYS